MTHPDAGEIASSLSDSVYFEEGTVMLRDVKRFRERHLDRLVALLGEHPDPPTKAFLVWLLRCAALSAGVVPASIQGFYERKGKGEFQKLTVPALQGERLSYPAARAIFRGAVETGCRAFLLTCDRRPGAAYPESLEEYAALAMVGALREAWSGPLFLQLGPLEVEKERYLADPGEVSGKLEAWVRAGASAGFFNVELDTSALMDPNGATFEDQHRGNFEAAAALLGRIRGVQPEGVTMAVGVTVSTPPQRSASVDDARAFLDGTVRAAESDARSRPGPCKLTLKGATEPFVAPPIFYPSAEEGKKEGWALEEISDLLVSAYHLAGVVVPGEASWSADTLELLPRANVAEYRCPAVGKEAASLFKRLGADNTFDAVAEHVDTVKPKLAVPEPFGNLVNR